MVQRMLFGHPVSCIVDVLVGIPIGVSAIIHRLDAVPRPLPANATAFCSCWVIRPAGISRNSFITSSSVLSLAFARYPRIGPYGFGKTGQHIINGDPEGA